MTISKVFCLVLSTLTVLSVSAHAAVSVLGSPGLGARDHYIAYPTEAGIGFENADGVQLTEDPPGHYSLSSEATFEQSHARVAYAVTITSTHWVISGDYRVRKMTGHIAATAEMMLLAWSFEVAEPTPFIRHIDLFELPVTDGIVAAPISVDIVDLGPDGNHVQGEDGEEGVFLPGTYDFLMFAGLHTEGNVDADISGDYRFRVTYTIPEPNSSILGLIGLCGCLLVRRRECAGVRGAFDR